MRENTGVVYEKPISSIGPPQQALMVPASIAVTK
jgi:hypothetical protein